jgi:hypothetical protein
MLKNHQKICLLTYKKKTVIFINENLDLLTKLKKWAVLNKDTPNIFKQINVN